MHALYMHALYVHALYMHAFEFCPSLPLSAGLGGGAIWSCRPWLDDRDAAPPRMGPFGRLRTFRGVPVESLTTHDVSAHALVIPLLTTRKATTNKPEFGVHLQILSPEVATLH